MLDSRDARNAADKMKAFQTATLAVLSLLASSVWIAICAAAPEFIWQGFVTAADHLTRSDILAGLLIGLILAFFIEPLLESARGMLGGAEGHRQRNALFTVAVSLTFAIVSVALHDAMIAVVTGRGAEGSPESAVAASVEIAAEWALVPFAVSVAWLSAGKLWLRIPTAIAAALSPAIAGLLFSWSVQNVVTTALPCLLILGLGYPRSTFGRSTRVVSLVGLGWLVAALFVNAVWPFHLAPFYDESEIWTDFRFYIGWTIGLLLAPFPHTRADSHR
jgi:hypothetical protein